MSDQAARDRILTALDVNLLVEAGAGSGKTTSLVGRLAALVAEGVPVAQLAAVTFTRQAAAELRERFQLELEARAAAGATEEVRARCTAALHELDRAFLGTIHAFAARLLREQALEAGVDPAFAELDEGEALAAQEEFWDRWLEGLRRDGDTGLAGIEALGLDPRALFDGFCVVAGNPDVTWPAPDSSAPDPAVALMQLRTLLARSRPLLPPEEPADGWDDLQRLLRQLHFLEVTRACKTVADAMALLELVTPGRCTVVQKRWSTTREGKAAAKRLCEEWEALALEVVAPLLERWREHRYGPVMRLLRRAAAASQDERRRAGRLSFADLLVFAVGLLRQAPGVRAALGERYRRLLVDEFQDTDPLQAELCFLLASDPAEGNDWRTVRPRPGSLFVVGDPKQSIYRFRRADLGTYTFVRERFTAVGEVLRLTRNFRSVPQVADLVNAHFREVFPAEATGSQAPFAAMEATREAIAGDGICRYDVPVAGGAWRKDVVAETDARGVAGWVAEQVAAGRFTPGDVLVLTQRKQELAAYARALASHGIPAVTTGAELRQERELAELVLLLRLLADPGDPVLLVAVLEGIFAGCTPAEILEARRRHLPLTIMRAPADTAGSVAQALLRLHRWWHASRLLAPDQLLDRLLDESGLLVHAASQPLGEERAGALLHLVESVRRSDQGMTGVRGMIEVLEQALASEDGVPVLRPGRSDTVRIMNLHKAKGLEAAVVILAAPVPASAPAPRMHVARDGASVATGWLQVTTGEARQVEVLAQPPGWERFAADEAALLEAERDRLLYVAATRPRRMLLVAGRDDGRETGLWGRLAPVLATRATTLELPERPVPGRPVPDVAPAELAARADALARERGERRRPTLEVTTVTRSLRQAAAESRDYDLPRDRDEYADLRARGDAIHRVLEAIGRGRHGESLRLFAGAVARDLGLGPGEVDGILAAADGVVRGTEWQDLHQGRVEYELPVMRAERRDGITSIIEGVIDAVGEREGTWQVVDWKSSRSGGDRWEEKLRRYQEQVDRYQAILRAAGLRAEGAKVVRVRGG